MIFWSLMLLAGIRSQPIWSIKMFWWNTVGSWPRAGAVVFHITNRYLNLEPVLAKIAEDSGAYVAIKDVGDEGFNMRSIWCILTWDDDRFLKLITQEDWQPLEISPKRSRPHMER